MNTDKIREDIDLSCKSGLPLSKSATRYLVNTLCDAVEKYQQAIEELKEAYNITAKDITAWENEKCGPIDVDMAAAKLAIRKYMEERGINET